MELGTLLFVIFLILKLCGVIAWSWWWVTSPLWIGVALAIIFYIIAAVFGITVGSVGSLRRRFK